VIAGCRLRNWKERLMHTRQGNLIVTVIAILGYALLCGIAWELRMM
jgi:hypothetical protein